MPATVIAVSLSPAHTMSKPNRAEIRLIEGIGVDGDAHAGVTVKRTGYDTSDLTNKALLAAQQGNSPDVLIVDNPVVSTLACDRSAPCRMRRDSVTGSA